jgi:ribosome recycling factor
METFVTSSGTSIIVHSPNLTAEEREERMKEIKESATRLLKKRKEKK